MTHPCLKYGALVLACLSLVGCKMIDVNERLDNVVRVLMHEPHRYTLMTLDPQTKVLKPHTYADWQKPDIIADVPPDQPMWATAKGRYDSSTTGCPCAHLEIHIHSATDINGAGWSHGKFGSGQTVVVK